jgi:hypothetical protein
MIKRKNVLSVYLTSRELDVDDGITLSELLKIIPRLQSKYGIHAKISFNAGYNNVMVKIKPTKKVRQKE